MNISMDLDCIDIANIALPSPPTQEIPQISLPSQQIHGDKSVPNIHPPLPANRGIPNIAQPSTENQGIPNVAPHLPKNHDIPYNIAPPLAGNRGIPNISPSLPAYPYIPHVHPPLPPNHGIANISLPSSVNSNIPNISVPPSSNHGIAYVSPPLPVNHDTAQGNQTQDVLQNRRRTSSENELHSSKGKQSVLSSQLDPSQCRLSDKVESPPSKNLSLSSTEFLHSTWNQSHHSNHARTLSEKSTERRFSECSPYSEGRESKSHHSNQTKTLSEITSERRLSYCEVRESRDKSLEKCESQTLTVQSQPDHSKNDLISSKWNQSPYSKHSRTFSEKTTERRLSECTPYSDYSERRESKEKNVKNSRSQSASLKLKPLYTMEDGRQFFASWSPGFKVQSREDLEKMEEQIEKLHKDPVVSASDELKGCYIAESQKSSDCLPVLADLSWEDLVFPCVLPMLSAMDLCRLRAVDRQHHEMVQIYITRNKHLNLGDVKKATKETFRVLTQGATNIRCLNLAGSKWLTDDLLRQVLMDNPHLEHINLSACHHLSAGILQTVTIKLKNVRSLILRDCHWVTKDAVQYHIYHQGQDKKLKQVDFTGCWELGDDILVELLSRFPGIEVLRLGNIYSLTDMVMRAVASYCRGIKHLDIKGCWRVTNAGVRLVGEYCRHLKFLEVSDCRDITEQSLTRLRKKGIRIDRPIGAVAVPRIPELQNNI